MIRQTRPLLTLVIVALLLAGVLATACASGPVSDSKVVRWVDKTVAERQPPAADKRFDEIGWVTDVRTAIKLGKEHNRPIYLFTGDGRINTGRC
jgi:major membrane immunogen (membrane-anchored lipoprotein)